MIDLNEMVFFAHVVKERSFTRAARALGMPKSTISKRISELEARLGVQLLQRTTRAVRPTDAGAAYYQRCQRVVAEAQEADAVVAALHQSPKGVLRVNVPYLFGTIFLGDVVAEYASRYPEVQIEVVLADRVVDLVQEGFDLAIRISRGLDAELTMRHLGSADIRCCASPRYLADRGTPKTLEDLEHHDCVIFGTSRHAKWRLERDGETKDVTVRGRLSANSMQTVARVVTAGMGIAYLPTFLCEAELREGKLVPVLQEWGRRATLQAVYPSSRHLPAHTRAFIDLLVEHFARTPHWGAAPSRR